MVNDPIGDLLIQIKNASAAGKSSVEVPYSGLKMSLCTLLSKEGYIGGITKTGKEPKTLLKIELKYANNASVIMGVKRISKPGLRWYVNKNTIPVVIGGMGIAVLSTPEGLMTGRDAKKKGIGGELLCTIW